MKTEDEKLFELQLEVLEGHLRILAFKRKTTNYVAAARAICGHSAGMSNHLMALTEKCIRENRPILTCLILKQETHFPANGFFDAIAKLKGIEFNDDTAATFFEDQKELCFRAYGKALDHKREMRLLVSGLSDEQRIALKEYLAKKE